MFKYVQTCQNVFKLGKDKFKARLYKTGDRARGLDNGLIDYMGRIDNQVKLRGFRIELGEIEARLMLRDDIKDIVVLLKGEGVNKQHKIGVGNFPGAMRTVPMPLMLALFYDDDRMGLVFHASSVVVCWFGFFTARTCSSSSINDGRSLE